MIILALAKLSILFWSKFKLMLVLKKKNSLSMHIIYSMSMYFFIFYEKNKTTISLLIRGDKKNIFLGKTKS